MHLPAPAPASGGPRLHLHAEVALDQRERHDAVGADRTQNGKLSPGLGRRVVELRGTQWAPRPIASSLLRAEPEPKEAPRNGWPCDHWVLHLAAQGAGHEATYVPPWPER